MTPTHTPRVIALANDAIINRLDYAHIPIRACHVCVRSRIDTDHTDLPMLCCAPECMRNGAPVNVKEARHPAGPCGIEARHLKLKE